MNGFDNDKELDRLLQGAFESQQRVGAGSPSMVDVRRRARGHQRRRVGGVVGATAMLGVSGVAVLASRGSSETGIAGDAATSTWARTDSGPLCGYTPAATNYPVTTIEPTTTTTWLESSSAPLTTTFDASSGTTARPLSCIPSGQFRCIGNNGTDDQGYTYFEYCESTEFSATATTTYPGGTIPGTSTVAPIITLATFASGQIVVVDAAGEGGAAATDAAYRLQQLNTAANVAIIPATRTEQSTLLVALGQSTDPIAFSASQVFGIDSFDNWDPSLILSGLPDGAVVVLVVGKDYFDRFGAVPTAISVVMATTTT